MVEKTRRFAVAVVLAALVALVAAPSAFASGSWRFTSSDHTSIAIDWATDNGQNAQYEVFTLTQPVAIASCGPGNPGVIGQPDGNPDQFECHGTPGGEVDATTKTPMGCGDQVQNKDSFDGSTYTPQQPLVPVSDNCNATPPPKNCDKEKQALAQAQAQLATDRKELGKSEAALAAAIGRELAANDYLQSLSAFGAAVAKVATLGLGRTALDAALEAFDNAKAEVDALKAVVAKEKAFVVADEHAVVTALEALQRCLNGGAQLQAQALAASASANDCGLQAKAFGTALGQMNAYVRLGKTFSRLRGGTTVTKLRSAAAKLASVAPALAHRNAKLAALFRKLASSLQVLAAALGKVDALKGSFPGKAASAQMKAAAAAKALAACENPPLTLQLSHTYTSGSPQLLYLCGKLTGPPNESGQIDVAAPSGTHAKGPFTFKANGTAGFNVRIVETGTFTVTVTAGTASVTRTYAVPGSTTPRGPFSCV